MITEERDVLKRQRELQSWFKTETYQPEFQLLSCVQQYQRTQSSCCQHCMNSLINADKLQEINL